MKNKIKFYFTRAFFDGMFFALLLVNTILYAGAETTYMYGDADNDTYYTYIDRNSIILYN